MELAACHRVTETAKYRLQLSGKRSWFAVRRRIKERVRRYGQSRSLLGGYVMRARLTLLISEGVPYEEVALRLGSSKATIIRWKSKVLKNGIED
jgi:DNA invertase Pin-like site-specific DNA recombinase